MWIIDFVNVVLETSIQLKADKFSFNWFSLDKTWLLTFIRKLECTGWSETGEFFYSPNSTFFSFPIWIRMTHKRKPFRQPNHVQIIQYEHKRPNILNVFWLMGIFPLIYYCYYNRLNSSRRAVIYQVRVSNVTSIYIFRSIFI